MDRFVPRDDIGVFDNAWGLDDSLGLDDAFPVIASAARQSMPRRSTVDRFVPRDDVRVFDNAWGLEDSLGLDDALIPDGTFPVIASAARQSMLRRSTVDRFVPRDDVRVLDDVLSLDDSLGLDDALLPDDPLTLDEKLWFHITGPTTVCVFAKRTAHPLCPQRWRGCRRCPPPFAPPARR